MTQMIRVGMTERYGAIVKLKPHLKERMMMVILSATMDIVVPKADMYVLFWLSDS